MTKKLVRIERRLTDEERNRHAQIRAAAKRDFPPKTVQRRNKPRPTS
jgi:hypothetical protein